MTLDEFIQKFHFTRVESVPVVLTGDTETYQLVAVRANPLNLSINPDWDKLINYQLAIIHYESTNVYLVTVPRVKWLAWGDVDDKRTIKSFEEYEQRLLQYQKQLCVEDVEQLEGLLSV